MKPFLFKHFSVQQSHAAMKVGTDAMLLGSLCNFNRPKTLLDIGTGTGVLALMIAQRFSPDSITALEVDAEACRDARANFQAHPFSSDIRLIHSDLRTFRTETLFDGIISNPPFFENGSLSEHAGRNRARHTHELAFDDLFMCSAKLLAEHGQLYLILPAGASEQVTVIAASSGLYLSTLISIEGKPGKAVRSVMEFRKQPGKTTVGSFVVRTADGSYTEAYIAATRDFHGMNISRSVS